MVELKTYSKAEDAYVAASLLESEGIEAVVIDDSAYGGNLLGATKAAIRIEVPENQLERAREILSEHRPTDVIQQPAAAGETGLQRAFRALVVLELMLSAIALWLEKWIFHTPEVGPVSDWLNSLVFLPELTNTVYLLWIPSLAMIVLSSTLLYFYLRIGRPLFIATMAWGALQAFAVPPVVPSAFGGIVGGVQWALIGAICALMFVPEVAGRFKKHVGD